MIAQAHDPAFRVGHAAQKDDQLESVCAGQKGSRLWESNPRPTHYEGRPHHPLPSLPATSLLHGWRRGAPSARWDASPRHNPCHDSSSNAGWTCRLSVWAKSSATISEPASARRHSYRASCRRRRTRGRPDLARQPAPHVAVTDVSSAAARSDGGTGGRRFPLPAAGASRRRSGTARSPPTRPQGRRRRR